MVSATQGKWTFERKRRQYESQSESVKNSKDRLSLNSHHLSLAPLKSTGQGLSPHAWGLGLSYPLDTAVYTCILPNPLTSSANPMRFKEPSLAPRKVCPTSEVPADLSLSWLGQASEMPAVNLLLTAQQARDTVAPRSFIRVLNDELPYLPWGTEDWEHFQGVKHP